MKKILLVSSSGGHFSELMQIKQNNEKYKFIVVTEKHNVSKETSPKIDYYLKYGTRSNKVKYISVFASNIFNAYKILHKERPDVIISTGAHSCVPFFYLAKFFGCKTIYIESYAKVTAPSLTYKLIKNKIDELVVQHQEMLEIYPNAHYFDGGIY